VLDPIEAEPTLQNRNLCRPLDQKDIFEAELDRCRGDSALPKPPVTLQAVFQP
jgi:hypothetical protein